MRSNKEILTEGSLTFNILTSSVVQQCALCIQAKYDIIEIIRKKIHQIRSNKEILTKASLTFHILTSSVVQECELCTQAKYDVITK